MPYNNFLGSTLSYYEEIDIGLNEKNCKFQLHQRTICRILKNKVRKDNLIKFYKTMRISCEMYGSENWTVTTANDGRIYN